MLRPEHTHEVLLTCTKHSTRFAKVSHLCNEPSVSEGSVFWMYSARGGALFNTPRSLKVTLAVIIAGMPSVRRRKNE